MKNTISIAVFSSLIVAGCGSKISGIYSIDIGATKATPEFIENNKQTNGGAAMGLQVISQIAKDIAIKDSKFRFVSFDCEIDSSVTKAECIDQSDSKAPKKILSFSSSGETIKIDAGDGYPLIYTKPKS